MMNNILQNIMMSKIPPQMREQIENVHKMAMQQTNPEQFLMQRFGNNPKFQQAMNAIKGKSPEEINNYLGNLYNTLSNGQINT